MKRYLLRPRGDEAVYRYDVLIIGAGLSGLYCALSLPETLRIAILSKGELKSCNSELAQGGIAVTLRGESVEGHIEDTLRAGSYYNDSDAVRDMIKEGHLHIEQLASWGVPFDVEADGSLSLTQEGGHTARRVVHSKDSTGSAVMTRLRELLAEKHNIDVYESATAVDLLTVSDSVFGAIGFYQNGRAIWQAKRVVLATGGVGHLYRHTTNAPTLYGDGMAMALRAGAKLSDMEMIQFHPTACYLQKGDRHFLISEAVRGEGARLVNARGEAFMAYRHPQGDLAPRDVVAREIFKEMQRCDAPFVYLDVTHLDANYIVSRFPTIHQTCLGFGIDICKDKVPVCPVEHYTMGGVQTDWEGRTSCLGLYAVGEVARTGVHGANRLASNSLLEALVYGHRSAAAIERDLNRVDAITKEIVRPEDLSHEANPLERRLQKEPQLSGDEAAALFYKVQDIVSGAVNIYRSRPDLENAHEALIALVEQHKHSCIGDEVGLKALNGLAIAVEMVKAALARRESLGAHQIEEVEE